jgi:pimeloyl-ACP methyl ester carboxylesterase
MQPTDVSVPVAAGVRLHVRRWGGATGTEFLLVHGLSSNARLWDGVARELVGAGARAYCVDLRSHGDSDAPADGHDTATAASDLAALCDRLGLRGAVVAGQSWGGNVVVRLAAAHPEAVSGLALVDGGWIDLSGQFASWEECEKTLRPPDVTGMTGARIAQYIRSEHPDWADWAIGATVANLRELPDGTVERRLSIPHHMQIVRSMWDDPPWRDLPHVAAPTMLLPALPVDAEAAAARRELIAKAAAALPRASIREYVGADHDLHAQHPHQLAADLLTLAGAR